MKIKRVCIDPGHGYALGRPTGAKGEDDLVLEIGLMLKSHLKGYKIPAVMTRETKNRLSTVLSTDLKRRVKIARDYDCDLFISLHANAFSNFRARGFEVIAPLGNAKCFQLASAIDKALGREIGDKIPSRGVKWDNQGAHKSLYVLRNAPALRVMIEVGFLTNPEDAKYLADEAFLQRITRAIVLVVREQG
jgi:N-acetylmuramoyl-L-alanine amidase